MNIFTTKELVGCFISALILLVLAKVFLPDAVAQSQTVGPVGGAAPSALSAGGTSESVRNMFIGTFTEELTSCPAGSQEVDGTLILNGALDYPIVATKNPSWVSSERDLQLPDWSGLFIRNSGSQSDYVAAAPGVLQDDGTAPNGLAGTVARTANDNVSTAVDSGGGQSVRFNNTTRSVTFTSADGETRPGNVALIKCVILEL